MSDFIPQTETEKLFLYYIRMDKEERKRWGVETREKLCKHLGISVRDYNRYSGRMKAKETPTKSFHEFLQEIRNSKSSADRRLYAELMGYLKKDKEIDESFEFSASDYVKIGQKVVERIRAEFRESGGICPVCGECPSFRNEARVDTESEHTED